MLELWQREFDDIAEEFPYIRDFVEGFENMPESFRTGGEFDTMGRNLRMAKSESRMKPNELDKVSKTSWIVNGETQYSRSMVVHETSHAVEQYIRFGMRGMDVQDDYFDAIDALMKSLPIPSKYAEQNRYEWLAERFTLEWMNSRDGEVIRMFKRFVPFADPKNLPPVI